ncbi:hypothetical protein K9O81_18900 [Leclercia adecarboxylata]|uniref:hypothetical protein n=1 Tax=Leclercia adecarboxylata TaxID=83655 RepID=UPI001CBCC307|nr:hypothetical protein [Leclercia adecarboxylata]MBZ3802440.1 hypothetical protein [Leclercia adecarboxylata]MBZ3807076.1 hypothetical protein [Leclercia adecarboxylata]UVN08017.1 MAG: hypothetical protein [Bacteriophage sp.]
MTKLPTAVQEPAQYQYRFRNGDAFSDWQNCEKYRYEYYLEMSKLDSDYECRALYEVPQLPQPAVAQEPIATLNSMTSENGRLPYGTIHFLRMPTEEERSGLLKLYAEPQLSQPAIDLREVFEAWARSKCWDVRQGETGAYISMCTHDGWTVVSACRDAIIAAKGDCR